MKDRIWILGLTGPTGAGKSTAARAMKDNGCRVIDADRVAREVVAPGCDCLQQLARAFGGEIVRPDGTLDRALLAKRAFCDPEHTQLLNSITHPCITQEIRGRIDQMRRQGTALIVLDAPLLFESGEHALCDAVAVVTAPRDMRLERIMKRDGISREQALERMSAQPEETFYTKEADYILDGSGEPDHLYDATRRLLVVLREE